jgi:hypothetical protein
VRTEPNFGGTHLCRFALLRVRSPQRTNCISRGTEDDSASVRKSFSYTLSVGNDKPMKQLGLLSRQADIRGVTGASSVNLRQGQRAGAAETHQCERRRGGPHQEQQWSWKPLAEDPRRECKGCLEISSSVRSGGKTKIAEVNLLGLTGDLDGTLTPRVVKTIETCSPKTSRLEGQSTQGEEAVNSNTAPIMHWASLPQRHHARAPQTSKPRLADQRRFADRGIRIVTLALGGDLGTDLGCVAIIMPSAHFYSCPSNDRDASSSDTSRKCYSTPPSSVHQERTP